MHIFSELIDRCAGMTIHMIQSERSDLNVAFQRSGSTALVKRSQALTLQITIVAIGMFSILEAMIQDRLGVNSGFEELKRVLAAQARHDLQEQFYYWYWATNVLKHGRGKSYQELLAVRDKLPFKLKGEGETFFSEGNVDEITVLIDVDDAFVRNCADFIREINEVIFAVHGEQI